MSVVTDAAEPRASVREKVFHRTRATLHDGSTAAMTLVDLSAHGFMARCEAGVARGDGLWLELPLLGLVAAEVRWALGGRFGCRLERAIPAATFAALVAMIGGANDG
jgi:hypothetical protein